MKCNGAAWVGQKRVILAWRNYWTAPYINNLCDNLVSAVKLFADDTSLFSTVYDNYASRDTLNGDSDKTAEWAFQWKIHFNPDLNKKAQKIIFSRKTMKPVPFNDSPVACTNILRWKAISQTQSYYNL